MPHKLRAVLCSVTRTGTAGARSNQLSLYALGVMWVCFQDYFRRFHDKIPERASRDMMRVQCRDVFVVRDPLELEAVIYYLVQPVVPSI